MVFIAQDKKKCSWEHTTCGPLCQVSSGLRPGPLEVLAGLSLLPSSYNFTSVCVVWVCFCVCRACACVSAPSGCQSSASSLSPKSPKRAASSSSLSVNISHEYFMALFFFFWLSLFQLSHSAPCCFFLFVRMDRVLYAHQPEKNKKTRNLVLHLWCVSVFRLKAQFSCHCCTLRTWLHCVVIVLPFTLHPENKRQFHGPSCSRPF